MFEVLNYLALIVLAYLTFTELKKFKDREAQLKTAQNKSPARKSAPGWLKQWGIDPRQVKDLTALIPKENKTVSIVTLQEVPAILNRLQLCVDEAMFRGSEIPKLLKGDYELNSSESLLFVESAQGTIALIAPKKLALTISVNK